jgi:hypothetical protein
MTLAVPDYTVLNDEKMLKNDLEKECMQGVMDKFEIPSTSCLNGLQRNMKDLGYQ